MITRVIFHKDGKTITIVKDGKITMKNIDDLTEEEKKEISEFINEIFAVLKNKAQGGDFYGG